MINYVCFVKLYKGQQYNIFMDIEDYLSITPHKCYLSSNGQGKLYLKLPGRQLLHRYLLNPEPKFVVDHINGNTLDNRKVNLRVCTHSQNHQNTPTKNLLGKGIRKTPKGKYQVIFSPHRGQSTYGGVFETLEEATIARDALIKKLHGEFTNVQIR